MNSLTKMTRLLLFGLFLGLTFTGCGKQNASTPDSKTLKDHAEELKKQHQKEMEGRSR
jgi:hypothetical protein